MRINELGQPIGEALPDFKPGDLPNLERIEGQYVIIERLSKDKHGADLYEVYGPDSPADMWTYLFQNAAQSQEEWDSLLDRMLAGQFPLCHCGQGERQGAGNLCFNEN